MSAAADAQAATLFAALRRASKDLDFAKEREEDARKALARAREAMDQAGQVYDDAVNAIHTAATAEAGA